MAVSGRKISDFRGSVSRGSAEDFKHSCDSCLTDGQHIEAHGFCTNCQEYLCSNCLRCHQRTKASKHHKLLEKDDMDKHAVPTNRSNVCTEQCSTHGDEIIKFFCPEHEELGCHDCMTMSHRTCEIDYITDTCTGIGDSEEYREVMKLLDQKMKQADALFRRATSKSKEIDDYHDKVTNDIVKFRKEINDHLDTIQKRTESDEKKMKSKSKLKIKAVLDSCTNMVSEIQYLQSSLQASKAACQDAKLFTTIKRSKSTIQSDKVQNTEISLDEIHAQIIFRRNTNLGDILSTDSLGRLMELPTAVATPPIRQAPQTWTPVFNSLTHKQVIIVRTITDSNKYNITGCAALASGALVLADYHNKKLKIVETKRNVVVEETLLDSPPYGITVLPNDQIAVTMPQTHRILIMNTANKLTIDYSIKVEIECKGITYHEGSLYVVCRPPKSVLVLDMKGNVEDKFSLKVRKELIFPNYIVFSKDHRHLYISDYRADFVVSLTLQGEVSTVYKHKDLRGPLGMLVLDDGSLLVCCKINNNIHHISADLTQGRNVVHVHDLERPQSIYFSADRGEVYIGCQNKDLLKVFSLQ